MPKCKINGQEIEVKEGTTIIEAFKQTGQDICHYCWHPGLSVAGVCRLCMVEIEGQPRLQIACNTQVQDGMVVSNQSEKVKETVRWGLDFHLINHPLDCPICDQAGECGLQNQYMKFGQYDPEMAERKVKKRKVVSLGERVVLDSERCILCSRCVRFTSEVTQTNELGIFNRGDRSEIGTFADKPMNNKYSLNTVDICPVGALTSKDFRFRQRVWYLKEAKSVCTGCSTGCNIKVFYNEEGLFRIQPSFNPDVNGYWMCDEGRDLYKHVNRPYRLTTARTRKDGLWETQKSKEAVVSLGQELSTAGSSWAVVLTGQLTNEEYASFLSRVTQQWGVQKVFHWLNHPESLNDFDGLLLRGDRNPNTKGLQQSLQSFGLTSSWSDLEAQLASGQIEKLLVIGPENLSFYPDLKEKIALFNKAKTWAWLGSGVPEGLDEMDHLQWQIPLKTFVEKSGTFVNHSGLEQKIKAIATFVPEALSLTELTQLWKGDELQVGQQPPEEAHLKQNFFVHQRGAL